MTDTELKRSLIARINQIQDPAFLKALMVITDGHSGASTKLYSWGEPSARNWLERKPAQDQANENFFEDMEQLLRDNNLSQERQS